MKTKIFKSVLPALAILLAMGLSFAVEANRVNQIGYYDNPNEEGIQQVPTDCDVVPNDPCLFGIYRLYADEELQIPLFERNP